MWVVKVELVEWALMLLLSTFKTEPYGHEQIMLMEYLRNPSGAKEELVAISLMYKGY